MHPDEETTPLTTNSTPDAVCGRLRDQLLAVEKLVRELVTASAVKGESAAQAMLSVRHLEDARMRLGKVIQYYYDGVSCYDKR